MPHGYEVMRDSFVKKGMSRKKAKKKAAMIWNAKHKGAEAVGPHRESIDSFANFMEKRREKATPAEKEVAYAHYGLSRTSTSLKNQRNPIARYYAIRKVKLSEPAPAPARTDRWNPVHRRQVTDFIEDENMNEDRGERLHQTTKNPDQAKPRRSRRVSYAAWEEPATKHGIRRRAAAQARIAGHLVEPEDMTNTPLPGKGIGAWSIAKEDIDNFANFMEEYLDESKAHPGFKKVQGQIAKKMGVSKERAGAILASKTRHASAAAKRKNPKLKKVKG